MSDRLDWMFLSFPLLSLGRLKIRVSFFFLLIAAYLAIRFQILGCILFGIVFVSVLLHELAHVITARFTGGDATEIHLTPIGGMATVRPGRGTAAQILTAMAGPFVNFLMCVGVFLRFYSSSALWNTLQNPFELPVGEWKQDQWVNDVCLLLFAVNWLLFLVNLLPILPLDGGQVMQVFLADFRHPELGHRNGIQFSIFASSLLMVAGLFYDFSAVVFLGSLLLIVNLSQYYEDQLSESLEDSLFMDEDGEGFSNFEKMISESYVRPKTRLSPLQRWREQRRLRKEFEERKEQAEAEEMLDSLLAKVHEQGMSSLTSREKRLLKQASDLLRDRSKRTS